MRVTEYTGYPKYNTYEKNKWSVGDIIQREKKKYKVIQIIEKEDANMYLCVDKLGLKTTFTDKDFFVRGGSYGRNN